LGVRRPGRVVAREDDVLLAAVDAGDVGVVALEHAEEHGRPLLELVGGEHPQAERADAAPGVRAARRAHRLRVGAAPRRVERLGLVEVHHLERRLHVRLRRRGEPGHLEVVPAAAAPDELVRDVDVVAAEGLDLGDRPLHQLLAVGRQPDLPRDRLHAGPALADVVGSGVRLVGPAPQHAAVPRRVEERLGRVEVAIVVAKPVVAV
ncbi:Os03g0735601, partial [Oryza sativa Japonica Group]